MLTPVLSSDHGAIFVAAGFHDINSGARDARAAKIFAGIFRAR
jgi:hypothetical protein